MSSLCRCVAAWGTRWDWAEGRGFLRQNMVRALCLRPFHADWRRPGIFLPSPSQQALPPGAGRQRAPKTRTRPLGCSRSAASTGQRARRKRDVLLWGRFLRHLDRNVPSRNIHLVAHSSQPDWGNGSRGCFTEGFSESYCQPTGLVRTVLCPAHLCCGGWNKCYWQGQWLDRILLPFLCFMLQVILEAFHREHISGSGCSISQWEFLLDQEISYLGVSTGSVSTPYLACTWLFLTPSQIWPKHSSARTVCCCFLLTQTSKNM